MKILAADTGTSIMTVALCDGEAILGEVVIRCGRAHSERLLETVDWLLAETGHNLGGVDALAIAKGPGSFTGLRIGVAAWKGLALGANRPLIGVPSLDAMARQAALHDGIVCPMLDARMGEVFAALYRFKDGQRDEIHKAMVSPVEEVLGDSESPLLCFGDGAELYRDRVLAAGPPGRIRIVEGVVPHASAVAREAARLIEEGDTGDAGFVEPVYLRKSQAEQNRAKAHAQ